MATWMMSKAVKTAMKRRKKNLKHKRKMLMWLQKQTSTMRRPKELRKHMVASKMNLRGRHATNRKPRSVRRSLMRLWMKSSN